MMQRIFRVFVTILFTILYRKTLAQTPVEVLAGNKQVHYIHYWQQNLDSAGRWNFFNLNRFAVDYRFADRNSIAIEGQLSYAFNQWLGISAGGGFEDGVFVPSLGLSLSYASKNADLVIEAYPTIQLNKPRSANIFGLFLYQPKLNQQYRLFTQAIVSSNFGMEKTEAFPRRKFLGLFTHHAQTTGLVRLGLNWKEKIQFGLGADLYWFHQGNFKNWGAFVRLVLP